MCKKITRWRNVEIVQQPSKSPEFLNNLEIFLNNCKPVDKFAYILHDKDLKTPHYHCLIKFKTPVNTETILNFFNGSIKYENLQHVCKWSAAVEYLTHKNDSSKHQYDVNEIVSNFNVNEFNASNSKKKDLFADLLERVSKGEMLDELSNESKENKKIINKNLNAFKYELNRYFKNKKRKYRLTNIYISGPGRTGKTTLAKQLAIAIVERFRLKKYDNDGFFMVGTRGVAFDNYNGEDVIIFDEFRNKDYNLDYGTLLRICDPYAENVTTSIKHSKITLSNLFNVFVGPDRFIDYVFKATYNKETLNQFAERFALVIDVNNDYFNVNVLSPDFDAYNLYKVNNYISIRDWQKRTEKKIVLNSCNFDTNLKNMEKVENLLFKKKTFKINLKKIIKNNNQKEFFKFFVYNHLLKLIGDFEKNK